MCVCKKLLAAGDAMFAEWCEADKWNFSSDSNGRIHLPSSRSDLPASGGKRSLMLEFPSVISARVL